MAELPELEVYAEGLRPLLAGRVLASVDVRHLRVLRREAPRQFSARVTGQQIKGLVRRGKTLAVLLGSGDRLDIHLMLRGEIYYFAPGPLGIVPQPVLTLRLDDGARLVLSDDHFNPMRPADPKMWVGVNKKERIGLDPLDPAFTPEALAALCRRHKILPVKALLCDQRWIGGLGNAYADEILWEAGIRPRRAASLMSEAEVRRLHAAVGSVLREAIGHLRELMKDRPAGEPRREFLKVHRRSGKPCPRCGGKIALEEFRDRPTNWCPACQP